MKTKDKTKKFEIDIDSLNRRLKAYLNLRLKDIWNEAEEYVSELDIHLVIAENEKRETYEDNINCYFFSRKLEGKYLEVKMKKGEEKLLWVKLGLPEDESKVIMKRRDDVTCGTSGSEYDSKVSGYIGKYSLYWFVENKNSDTKEVCGLMMKVIAVFLVKCIKDIVQICIEEDDCFNVEPFKKTYASYNFFKAYKKQLRKRYPYLPTFDICCKISKTAYENRKCFGKIMFIDEHEFEKSCRKIKLINAPKRERKIDSKSIHDVRKMLEVCQDKSILVATKNRDRTLLGFFSKKTELKDAILVEFKGEGYWRIVVNEEEILNYRRDTYVISTKQYLDDYASKLTKIEGVNIENPEKIFEQLAGAEHGALMIIAEDAAEQAKILCEKYNRGNLVEGFSLPKDDDGWDIIKSMASVDGAILVDFEGSCHAFGVILDGEAKIWGETERGARYNSSRNYVAGKNRVAIIVSEDKDKPIIIEDGNLIAII